MRYIPPAHDAILDIATQLKKIEKDDPQWLSFIAFLDRLTALPDTNALIGAIIFELEKYDSDFFLKDDQKYHHLQKVLNITEENVLKDDVRLYYLNKLYRCVHRKLTDDFIEIKKIDNEIQEIIWQGKNDLLADIKTAMQTVIDRDAYRIGLIVHATPELLTVRKTTKKIANLYLEARKKRWSVFQKSDRKVMLQLLEFLDYTFYDLPPSKDKKKISTIQEEEWNARCGLIICILLDIDASSFFSPKGNYLISGSELYKICLPVLRIEDLSELPIKQKKTWLKSLANYVSFIQQHIRYYQTKKKVATYDIATLLNQLQLKIEQLIENLHIEKCTPSTQSWLVSSGASFITRQGISYLMNVFAVTGVGATMAANVGGIAAGVAVYAGGTVLMTGLGNLITQNALVETAATYVYAWILERIGEKVGDSAANMITHQSYTITKGGLTALRKTLSEEEDQDFVKWVNTLLSLPEDIFPQEQKQIIRNVLGLEAEQKLKPWMKEIEEIEEGNSVASPIIEPDELPRVRKF